MPPLSQRLRRKAKTAPAASASGGRRQRGRFFLVKLGGAATIVLAAAFTIVVNTVGDRVIPPVVDRLLGNTPTASSAASQDGPLVINILRPGQFVPASLPHYGIYAFTSGTALPADVPADTMYNWSRYTKWAAEKGALPAGDLVLRLTLRGHDETPVVVNGMRVEVVRRVPTGSGPAWFRDPEPGCGGQPLRAVSVDLSKQPPRVVWEAEDSTGKIQTVFRVTRSDIEEFEIHFRDGLTEDVTFKLFLLYEAEGGAGEVAIDGGREFTVMALHNGLQAYGLAPDGTGLTRMPNRDTVDGSYSIC